MAASESGSRSGGAVTSVVDRGSDFIGQNLKSPWEWTGVLSAPAGRVGPQDWPVFTDLPLHRDFFVAVACAAFRRDQILLSISIKSSHSEKHTGIRDINLAGPEFTVAPCDT